MNLQQGTLLQGGNYKIEKVLGQGGFGITYLATQVMLDCKVCIKEFFFKDYCTRNSTGHVTSSTDGNKDMVARFLNKFLKEAQTISRLDHPNIIRILNVFEENSTAYYVMEYIDGCSLADKVCRQGALSENQAIEYIKQIGNALDYIHQNRINHLDIKPANIMVQKSDNKAILIDFGVSKQYDVQGCQTSTTPVGVSHGYAPMEQYNAGGVSTFSPQTDIYSLGATLYKLVTGHTPPQAGAILNDGLPQLPSHLSKGVINAIIQAMQVRKKDRPQNVRQFLLCLKQKEVVNEETYIHSESVKVDIEAKKTANKKTLGITFVLIIVFLGIGIYLMTRSLSDISYQSYMPEKESAKVLGTIGDRVSPKQKEFRTQKYSIKKEEGNFKYSVQVDYPIEGNENVALNIKEWIVESLSVKYDGSLDDPKSILEAGYRNAKKEWDPEFPSESQIEIRNIYKTNNFITYEESHYGYGGGAHGFSHKGGVTFRSNDGRRFGWDMIVKERSLKYLIIEDLKRQYFEVNTDDEFFDIVTEDRSNFPFPETAPWITSEGVVFQYQEYEIAAYAYGKPYCVIPLSVVQNYFSSSAKSLLE